MSRTCPKQKGCKYYRNQYGLHDKDYHCIYRDYDIIGNTKIWKCLHKKEGRE